MRTTLVALAILAGLAAPRHASASICDLYYDVTAWPRYSAADPACGLGMLSEYGAYEIDRLSVQVYVDDAWVDVETTIEETVLPLTVWWGACNDDCTLDEWTEEVEYLHYQIAPAEPWPAGAEVRLLYLDPIDELPRELVTWRIAEPDGFGECHTPESVWDPGCYESCPCWPEDDPPDADPPGDGEGSDDDGIYGCSAAGGSGAAVWLIVLAAAGLRRRRDRG